MVSSTILSFHPLSGGPVPQEENPSEAFIGLYGWPLKLLQLCITADSPASFQVLGLQVGRAPHPHHVVLKNQPRASRMLGKHSVN